MVPAGVAELADARDSKSRSPCESVGSTPSSGTNRLQQAHGRDSPGMGGGMHRANRVVVGAFLRPAGREAVAAQVAGDNLVGEAELVGLQAPVLARAGEAVDEDERRRADDVAAQYLAAARESGHEPKPRRLNLGR